VPADHVRDVPDVSLMAGNAHYDAIWLVCEASAGTTCTTDTSGDIFSNYSGGTSAAAPAFAGILALVEQRTGKRIGSGAAGELYSLFNIPAFASKVFNDITLGNNSVPCIPSSVNCDQVSTDNFFLSGYNAGVGYDLATGLGSVNATNLVEFWGAPAPAPATVAVKPAAASIFRGTSLAVAVTVAGKSGTPAGTVQLTGGGFTSAAKSLTSGKVTFTIPSSVLKAGVDVLTATYSGSVQFNTAVGTAKVTVTLLTPTVTVTPAALTASRAKSLLVSIRVGASTGTPTGTVTLASGSYKSAAATLVSGKAKITIPADALHAGKDVVTATYTGVGNYKSASGEVKITVTE
jgi:subtilase family serine protease